MAFLLIAPLIFYKKSNSFRCGAGTNNVPVARMTELGIPVFNTPGANANAVKELVLCGMLLGSRRIIDGINHMKELGKQGLAKERVEKDKAMFGGQELRGKTLAVIGLGTLEAITNAWFCTGLHLNVSFLTVRLQQGHIGSMAARDAFALGMKLKGRHVLEETDIINPTKPTLRLRTHFGSLFIDAFLLITKGYDPGLSVQSALKLPRSLELSDSIVAAVSDADYVSLNIPYIKGEEGTHGIIGAAVISHFKPNAVLLNFACGELIDSEAVKQFLDAGDGRYVTDFPEDLLWNHKNAIVLPHLGASTGEAEDAAVSADTPRL